MVYPKHLGAWCQTGEIAFILESGEIIQTSRSCPDPVPSHLILLLQEPQQSLLAPFPRMKTLLNNRKQEISRQQLTMASEGPETNKQTLAFAQLSAVRVLRL